MLFEFLIFLLSKLPKREHRNIAIIVLIFKSNGSVGEMGRPIEQDNII